MKCLKNPRYKHRNEAEYLGRAMEINTEHIIYLLHTCMSLYPNMFYPKVCREFILDYMDTCKEFECDDDIEERNYKIEQYLKDMPYITKDTAGMIYARLRSRPMSAQDKNLYSNPTFAGLFTENILLMLLQLHYSNGLGQSRLQNVVACWAAIDEPWTWLKNFLKISIDHSNEDVYSFLSELDRAKKKKSKTTSTLREQLDAKRELEALKAYQDEVNSHDDE